MQTNLFRDTERKLYNYFDMDMLLRSYINKIECLNQDLLIINRKIKTIDVDISPDIQAISYSECVQTSNDGSSYAERTLIKITNNLINDFIRVKNEINTLEIRIRKLKTETKIIKENIDMLRGDLKEFVERKYKQKQSNKQIAYVMNMSEATITRIKKRALKVINSWEDSILFK